MSANSDASSVRRPLCYCGVLARVRYSWTDTYSGKKWYGCENYKVFFEIKIVILCSLVGDDIFYFLFHAEKG